MRLPILTAIILAAALPLRAESWNEILQAARGQTVYWNAWGGDSRTNDFILWASDQVEERYGVTVRQVKLTDTSEAVARVVAEKAAGQDRDGSVDLIWINGANFLSMKDQGLLHGPFVQNLPNARFVDLTPGAAAAVDFAVPVEGYEAPWRLAKFVLIHDSARLPDPPRSVRALADWVAANPGRFTHPAIANFMGATFLKQALIELTPNRGVLQKPATDVDFDAATQPLWDWYDALRPNLWRAGKAYPENASVLEQMLNDGEVDIAMAFDPASAAAAIEKGLLPDTARAYGLDNGTIGNISFVAIPYNAAHKEGAMVLANFLLDPAAQAHAQDISVLGSYSVLDPGRLGDAELAAFAALPTSPALPTLQELGETLIEPHPSWMTMIAEVWAQRYTQ